MGVAEYVGLHFESMTERKEEQLITMHNDFAQRKPFARRDFLRVGALAFGGLGYSSLANSLMASATTAARAKSCILLWLDGGPSHLETFDPKRNVPVEVRGPFEPIATTVPGMEVSELLPQTAKIAKHLAIVRSVTSPLGEHGIANHYMLTGQLPSPQIDHPSFGSVLAHADPRRSAIPPYVVLPELRIGMGSGFLGTDFEPFVLSGDLSKHDFRFKAFDTSPDIDLGRIERRQRLLRGISSETQNAFEPAFEMSLSQTTRQAFDLERESATVRERYGTRPFGQGCLMARRLIEQGVRLVTVVQSGWDTHDNVKLQLRDGFSGAKVGVGLVPTFDTAFAALIDDLQSRGLLDETLVVAMGEFGRTPKINTRGGRDHWPRVFSAVFAGGGINGGQVIGSSDRVGESPRDVPVAPPDIVHTIYRQLGLDPSRTVTTPDGRPIAIGSQGKAIPGLT